MVMPYHLHMPSYFLETFTEYPYAAYEQFEQMKGITLVGCWAHGRRKYVDALEENRTLVTQAIHYIGRLYKVESDAG